jgi:hypothetical protein
MKIAKIAKQHGFKRVGSGDPDRVPGIYVYADDAGNRITRDGRNVWYHPVNGLSFTIRSENHLLDLIKE